MNIWNLTLIGLTFLGLGINLAKHGEDKKEKYNIWKYLIATAIAWFIYYKAGIFNF